MAPRPPDSWRVGELVHVPPYGKGTILEARNGGRYLVLVKDRAIVFEGTQIQPLEPARSAQRRARDVSDAAHGTDRDSNPDRAAASLDLHGRTVQEAIEALDEFLNAALLRGDPRVRVIHGRSGGRVRGAVHTRLKQVTAVRTFRIDPRNAGVTIVDL